MIAENNSKLLTAAELAKELKVSLAAIRVWQGLGLPHVPVGRLRRYNLENAIGWLRDRDEKRRLAKKSAALL